MPATPDPLDASDDTGLALGSFLSLAAPAVVISDSTFGGQQLLYEYAGRFPGRQDRRGLWRRRP
ncbi:hypothetical protein OG338_09630 [Streptomyces sp. NBC_00726]|uniref:hypothetical protein n=1 Tax=Streptomyces sp. NBC_00726 TaxID=2903674 RepID=UPI0038651D74